MNQQFHLTYLNDCTATSQSHQPGSYCDIPTKQAQLSKISSTLISVGIYQKQHRTISNCEHKSGINNEAMISEVIKEKSIEQWDHNYSEKRRNLMLWLQNYGECFGVKRETVALSQYYCDLYYKSETYVPKKVKMTLAGFLVIASKASDSKILLSSQISQIFQFPQQQFEDQELMISSALNCQLNNFTYINSIDLVIQQLKENFGYDLMQQNEEKYEMLCHLYFLAESLYIQFTFLSALGIYKCFQIAFQRISHFSSPILHFLSAMRQQIQYHSQQNYNICRSINLCQNEWEQKLVKVKQRYHNRSNNSQSYNQFIFKYASFSDI